MVLDLAYCRWEDAEKDCSEALKAQPRNAKVK